MPRPTDKSGLLSLGDENLKKLFGFIESLPKDYQTRTYGANELNDRDKTIADVICHLHEWHVMMKHWYEVGMSGKKPSIPADDVTWATLPILNHRIHEKHKGTELAAAMELLKKSHDEITEIIKGHTDDDLFTKKKYVWTGTTSLGAYLVSATSSHYDWALKTIKPIKKLIK